MLISIETHITCDFQGGSGPLSPSGSAPSLHAYIKNGRRTRLGPHSTHLALLHTSAFAFKEALVNTEKPVLSGHSKRRQKLVFKTDYHLMQAKSIAECSNESILQYV